MDVHRIVLTRSIYLWIASALVMTLNGLAAMLQDRNLIITALACTGLVAVGGIAFGVWAGLKLRHQPR